MEEIDDWYLEVELPPVEYVAVFDPVTGVVMSVGPSIAFENEENKIPILDTTAIDIIEGRIKLHSCFIDTDSETLEITENQNLYKIDDVIHRVISTQWTNPESADIFLTHSSKDNKIKVELAKKFGGTKTFDKEIPTRRMFWNGESEMFFTVTGYNDPHIIYESFSIKLSDLVGNFKLIKLGKDVPKRFSVYTRRLFKNYMIEYK